MVVSSKESANIRETARDTRRWKVSPVAMPRTPPPGLRSAVSRERLKAETTSRRRRAAARQPSSGATPGSPQSLSDGGVGEHDRRVGLKVEEVCRHVLPGRRWTPSRIGQSGEGLFRARRDRSTRQNASSSGGLAAPRIGTSKCPAPSAGGLIGRSVGGGRCAAGAWRACGCTCKSPARHPISQRGSRACAATRLRVRPCPARERGGAATAG